jgi:hypothetical protein
MYAFVEENLMALLEASVALQDPAGGIADDY